MRRKFRVVVNGKEYMVEIEDFSQFTAHSGGSTRSPPKIEEKKVEEQMESVEGAVRAPMSGKVLSIKVKKGDRVKEGDLLMVIEAMKMENEILAPKSGIIKDIRVAEGENVDGGEVLLIISEDVEEEKE